MSKHKPRVSIGLPVFNGEDYLVETLDSILAQTYTDFKLIISDNASTDRTPEICKGYAAKDRRIRYYRNKKNLGAAPNFNRVFELSSGEYFKWAAHDDIIAPDFLERCVEVLDHDPSMVLCHSKLKLIDENGKIVADYDTKLELNNVGSPKPQDRFGDLILIPHYCFDIFGLIRVSALKMTPLIASHIGSDKNLLAELGLLGRFYQIPEYLFFSRDHSERSIRALPLHSRAAWFDTANRGRLVFPRWSLFLGYFKSVRRTSLSRYERTWCYIHMGKWLLLYGRGLAKDLIVAAYQILHYVFTPETKNQGMPQKAN
jgi:glycosyltransferase involved in cell wall biosynthesis